MKKNPKGRHIFEVVLGDLLKPLIKKYGKNIPEIELLSGHVENVASIYNACDCHISTTGAEGWGMIFQEAAACGLINIAPRYSAQLDFLGDDNSLLIDTELRNARNIEQYWAVNKGSKIGQPSITHTAELMKKAFNEKDQLLKRFKPEMKKMVNTLSWEFAAQRIIDIVDGKISRYEPGTYNLKNQHKMDCSGLREYWYNEI